VTAAEGFRRGIRIGVDVGSVRVGVARSDPDGVLAVPVTTLARPKAVAAGRPDLTGLVQLVVDYEPVELIIGLPVGLDGGEGPAAAAVRVYADDLVGMLTERGLGVPVRLVDERMTTAEATRGLQAAGRNSRQGRSVIDQAAAVIIVQHALDTERATGTPPGTLLAPPEDTA
jgi:putative Holliday junction resolvase